MTVGIVLILFLVAAILMLLDFFLGWAADTAYGPYRYRVYSLAWGLMAVAFLLWHGNK
jgi:hypothetical protein